MDIETRLTRLEDHIAIRDLRANYCYAADDHDWDAFVDLFTPDVHLDFGPIGQFDGHDGVRELAATVEEEHPFLVHMMHNPVVEFEDSNRATGRWYVEVPCTFRDDSAGWIQATYLDEYRREGEEWLFEGITAEFSYFADYREGWADIVL